MLGNTELRWVTKHGETERCLQYGVNNGWGTVWNDIQHHDETKEEYIVREKHRKHSEQIKKAEK